MSDKKVSVSNILHNQFPAFVGEENPLFVEFLKQYYISQETEYGNINLSENIPDYKNISKYSDINLSNIVVRLQQPVLTFDDTITVTSTTGFPDKYGLLRIGNEIITYTGKTATTFTGCARGFSGITNIESSDNPEFLTFKTTEASEHQNGSVVLNLSFVFLREFFKKFKNQFLPGFENRPFNPNVSVETFLSTAKTFYASKGTDESLKILFKVLYGKSVDIIKPFDSTIKSSDARWVSTDDMIVEAISGNPLNLKFSSIFQDSFENPSLYGIISNVEEVFVGTKKYYKISFEKNSLNGSFDINNKTRVVSKTNTETVVTVDSTIGFPESGYFNYRDSIGNYLPVSYQSKSHNQFFDCVGLSTSLDENTQIINHKFVYGYENNNENVVCKMRVVGSTDGLTQNSKEITKYFAKDDVIKIKYVGEQVPPTDKKFNSWFHNNVFYVEALSVNPATNNITTKANHYLHRGDRVDVINRKTNQVAVSNSLITQVINPREFQIETGSLVIGIDYLVKRKIGYVSNNLNLNYLLADIQNTFVDKDKNAYVVFSGYPSYESIETTDRSRTFVSSNISENTLFLAGHDFINGEKIFYQPLTSNSGIVGISSGVYYVGVVNNDNIKLYISRENLYLDEYLEITGSGSDEHKIGPENLFGLEFKNQNNFKRILQTKKNSESSDNIIGAVGVGVNGVELHSPISKDSVFYGQIEKVNVLNPGNDYDVVDPPEIGITDLYGSSCELSANFSGSISEVILDTPGFDYTKEPVVTITGGNGSGAVCETKLKGYYHSISFSDNKVNLSDDSIELGNEHKFLNGEEVVYTTDGLAIGIGSTNVGFTTSRLSNGGIYYVSKINDTKFAIASSQERAVNGSQLIDLLAFGNKTHTFTSTKNRKIIDRIVVKNQGALYSNRKVTVNSAIYPPVTKEEIFKTFVGINTVDNYIFARNHSFRNGDILEYSTTGTAISGLSTSNYYKVKVIDNDRFKLSFAGNEDNIITDNYDKEIYSDISSVGVGTHTFKYPRIKATISGPIGIGTTNAPSYYTATASVSVKGSVDSVFVKNGGVGYGITNIVNLIRRPSVTLKTGKNGSVKLVVDDNGSISFAYVENSGSDYTTPPILEVVGTGKYAKLKANVVNGSITSVSIINKGVGYTKTDDNFVRVIPAGENAILSADVYEWKVNAVEKSKIILNNQNYKGTIQYPAEIKSKGKKLISYYATREIRKILYDNLDPNTSEELDELTTHSPIIGWAYDGNPIYGPFGNAKAIPDSSGSGGLKRLLSSYTLNPVLDGLLRPNNYPDGYFINDYLYDNSGDLDEYNGRYIVNADFPNGTYAYFSTVDENKHPRFPYITIRHKNKSDEFNYDTIKSQSDVYLNTGDYRREITSLGLNQDYRTYTFLDDQLNSNVKLNVESVKKSTIDSIKIKNSGDSYNVGDLLRFDNDSITASVHDIVGKKIVSVGVSESIENNLVFTVKDNIVTATKESPILFSSGDVVEISGITSSYYKNIEGFRTIESSSVFTTVSVAIGATTTTGISTFIALSEPTSTGNIKRNDIIGIGSEQLLVRFVDDLNNRYFVNRIQNDSIGSAHTAGKTVSKLSNKFTFKIDKKLENTNNSAKQSLYFDATTSVGIGTTYKNSIIGFAGSDAIYKSIPPRSIYLPNHQFNTGDKVSLVSIGGTIEVSKEFSLTPVFDLSTFPDLYCIKFNNDFIGLSSQLSGITTSYFYFDTATGNNHKIENVIDQIFGNARRYDGRVTLDTQHTLKIGDEIKLNLSPKSQQKYYFKYNDAIKKLVVNPISFASTHVSVGSTQSYITIENHGYETGDVVVYTSNDPITPLVNNKVYYIIKNDKNSIKLAENLYNAKSFPYQNIGITSIGSGTHEFALLNPGLNLYVGNTAVFSTYDPSLSGYDINFYTDREFVSRYNSSLIRKIGIFGDEDTSTEVRVSVSSTLPESLYYRIEGLGPNYTNTYPSSVDTSVINYSKIRILDSEYNRKFVISGVGSTTIRFTFVGYAETTSYVSSGLSTAYYSTTSKNESGKINSVKILNAGLDSNRLPVLTSIATTSGSSARINSESNKIGQIVDIKTNFQGVEFTTNKTLTPKASTYTILKLDNTLSLGNVAISTGGKNYTAPPKTIAIGNDNIILDTKVRANSVYEVNVLARDSGLSEDLRIVPTNNTNGVTINNATSEFQVNTLSLRAPLLGFTVFPFEVGDKIFVENVKILGSGDGYNSQNYGYDYFTVTGINTVSGSESVSYSIAGLGVTGGVFDPSYVFGRVIKETDLAKYSPVFEKVVFLDGELIRNLSGTAYATVAKNGWDPDLQTLKIENIIGTFSENEKIVSAIGNYKSTIDTIYEFDCDLNINSLVRLQKDWEGDEGKLNFESQRLHDNDYYQRFSYSVKGEVDYETWNEPVNSLVHTSGFKGFANYEILNGIGNSVILRKDDSDLLLNTEIISESSVYDRYFYDLVSEDTNTPNLSKIVKFDSKILTDYNESRTNKVLLIDNIASQFNGFTTSTGGQIVGLTSFKLYSSGLEVLTKSFVPSNINLTNSTITIADHQFETGENLIYEQSGGTPVGIETVSIVGLGSTDILPSSVYAIKISKDTIKLAIGKSEADASNSVEFTSVGTGLTHRLSVESDLAATRALITIDNIIQSPISRKDIALSLSTSVGSASSIIYLDDVSNIQGKSLIKIESEIIKVDSVGIGSTNSLTVTRGFMGTVSAAHTVGAAVTALSGDFRIDRGYIYFVDAPYSRSNFFGRVFYKLSYNDNYVIDDISEQFDSSTSSFNLTRNGQTLSGIQSSFGAILINNIFQRPFYGDVGSILKSDYEIVGAGQTIQFTGSGYEDLPRGGVINEFSVGIGSGYQFPTRAYAYAVVSVGGTIESIGLSTSGSGYISAPRVSIADTLGIGVGASVIASISSGIVTAFTIVNPGTGYTTSSPPILIIDEPSPYTNIPLSGGTGSNASMNVVVGTGGSITSFEIENRGHGYSVGDVLTLTQLPYQVGIGTSAFNITVNNRYQSKFSGWTFGQLLELDDFSNLFNGFRKAFLLTRTIAAKEYYSIVAQEGSGIILQNNLLIFINDVLQRPGIDYTFTGGTRLNFVEAPKFGSKLKIYFYVGSSTDYISVDVNETVKAGDSLRLQKQSTVPSQETRIIYELIASDTVETQTYGGVGISTNSNFTRPVVWSKQTTDTIIDGEIISKERDYLEPQIYPSTSIIASVGSTDSKIYVKNIYPTFNALDNLGQTLNDVRIVGLGTTVVSERFNGVTYNGDYGLIVGIGTSATGINTTSPMLMFDIIPDLNIVNDVPAPGISTGDYFVIENTIIGSGLTSIIDSESNIVSVGNSFIDNVYYASHVDPVSLGSSTLRVYSNVLSLNGISTESLPTDLRNYGTYTWGSIDVSRSANSKQFEFYNQNGILGIETSAYVYRLIQIRLAY